MTADPVVTGAIAQAPSPAQPQPQQESQPRSAAPAAAAAVPAARPKPDTAPKPKADTATKPAPPPKPAAAASATADPAADGEAAQFCRNISDAASDARFGWQVRVLEQLDKQVKESTERLEIKRAEYEDWLKRREDFLKKVEDGVVEMYGRMRPEAAAPQIASMTEEVALSVLMKLKPRTSSAILSEMEPTRAARLTDSLAGVRLTTREQGKTP
jgi:flagellar motility protein MotE (MotC chaperone)